MADEAKRRYNETRYLLMKLEDVADEAAAEVDGLPGAEAALEGIASTAQALRSNLDPGDFGGDEP